MQNIDAENDKYKLDQKNPKGAPTAHRITFLDTPRHPRHSYLGDCDLLDRVGLEELSRNQLQVLTDPLMADCLPAMAHKTMMTLQHRHFDQIFSPQPRPATASQTHYAQRSFTKRHVYKQRPA